MINVRYPNHVMIDASSSKVEEDEEETFDGKVRHIGEVIRKGLSFSLLLLRQLTSLFSLTDILAWDEDDDDSCSGVFACCCLCS